MVSLNHSCNQLGGSYWLVIGFKQHNVLFCFLNVSSPKTEIMSWLYFFFLKISGKNLFLILTRVQSWQFPFPFLIISTAVSLSLSPFPLNRISSNFSLTLPLYESDCTGPSWNICKSFAFQNV